MLFYVKNRKYYEGRPVYKLQNDNSVNDENTKKICR